MRISKRCEYALRAVLELASKNKDEPVSALHIARRQGISRRFLEAILNELKRGGFVESVRGKAGGYILARAAADLTVGEIYEFIEGAISGDPHGNKESRRGTVRWGDNAFKRLWQEVNHATFEAWNSKTFADLVELERNSTTTFTRNYTI